MGVLGFSPRNIAIEKSREAALKAVGLDEGLSEAHVSLASARLSEHSWSSAEKELQRAIALNPNNAMAHQWYGYLLSALGRFDAALSEMKTALELDPLSSNKQNSLAATYYRAGRYDEALEEFRKVADPDGNSAFRHRRMAFIYERRGSTQDAAKEWAAVLHWSGKTDAFFQRKLASEGYESAKTAFLRNEIHDLQTQMQKGYPGRLAVTIAGDYATLREPDKAFEWLDRALEEGESDLMYLKVDNRFEALRSDVRFAELARRLGLGQ
jgi:tetratricopeptide (TPR) repeat protein